MDRPSLPLLWFGGLLLPAILLLGGCGGGRAVVEESAGPPFVPEPRDGAPDGQIDLASIPDAVPRIEPRSRYGNPDSYEVLGKRYHVMEEGRGYVERGIASWYGTKFHGRLTSSREPYDLYRMTAAHKTLPLPTYAQVTNLANGRKVIVKVNDRGPFHPHRIIDLSFAAAKKLGIADKGTGFVEVRAIDPSQPSGLAPRPPDQPEPPAGGGAIYLQVGAFASRVNAELLGRRLERELGSAVTIQPSDDSGQTLYRVRLGPVQDADEADRLTDALATQGIAEPRVVTE